MAHLGGGKQKKWKKGGNFSWWHFVIFPHNLKEEVSTSANDLRRRRKKKTHATLGLSRFSFFPRSPPLPPHFIVIILWGERERKKRERLRKGTFRCSLSIFPRK